SDRIALAEDGIVAREPESLMNVPIFAKGWDAARLESASVPGDALWFGAAGDNAWWWTGSALVNQNRRSGQYAAYFPWVDSGIAPRAFAADSGGIWIGSNQGLRHLDPIKPDAQGFAGFLRAPLDAQPVTLDPAAKK